MCIFWYFIKPGLFSNLSMIIGMTTTLGGLNIHEKSMSALDEY